MEVVVQCGKMVRLMVFRLVIIAWTVILVRVKKACVDGKEDRSHHECNALLV